MRNEQIYKVLFTWYFFSIVSILVIYFLWKDLANALFWTGVLIAGIGVIYINPSNKIVPRQGDINMSSDDHQVIIKSSGRGMAFQMKTNGCCKGTISIEWCFDSLWGNFDFYFDVSFFKAKIMAVFEFLITSRSCLPALAKLVWSAEFKRYAFCLIYYK